MRLYFVRHGQSEANVLRVMSNRGSKHGLTEVGRQQVQALASSLEGSSFGRLFTSPLLRAVQTAEILSAVLAVDYRTTDALREFDCGVLEGAGDEAGWQVHAEVVDAWIHHKLWDRRIEEGESFNDIKDRFVPFLQELVENMRGARTSENAILVGHGGILRCMLPLVLENVGFEFAMAHSVGYAGCVVAEDRGEELYCIDWDGAGPP